MPGTAHRSHSAVLFLCVLATVSCAVVNGFSSTTTTTAYQRISQQQHQQPQRRLYSSVKDEEQTSLETEDDDETPAGIGGSEFFGGNKQKEEFFDPAAELAAGKDIELKSTSYNRFSEGGAFDSPEVAALAQSLQQQINNIVYADNKDVKAILAERAQKTDVTVSYGRSLVWETPVTKSSSNPMEELLAAKNFYNNVDLAIIGGKRLSDDRVEFSWELSLLWPTFWTPRVVLSGTSQCTLDGSNTITKQVDTVFGAENNIALVSKLGDQIKPRFWDWYHIGMTPSAEQVPRSIVTKKGKLSVYQIPAQWVIAPTRVETGTRENRNAEMIPNHAFTCSIKTMGPKKDVYIPTTPVEVRIGKNTKKDDNQLLLSWSIPLSTQFQAINTDLPLPAEDDPEDEEGSFPDCSYEFQPRRQVATIPYGGNVQDEQISDLRKTLYEQVLKEGWKPKLGDDGKPRFFFWQNDVKACYIEDGLGMCVYDWRPEFAESNEVGIELVVE